MPNVLTAARARRALVLTATVLALGVVLAACGSSSSGSGAGSAGAEQLLTQTFHGKHPITSGDLNLQLRITPSGSSELTQPITLSLAGPFESGGKGTLPESDFTIDGSLQGENLRVSVISAAGHGYIAVDGNSYPLPKSTYTKLQSGFSSVSGSGTASGTSAGPLGSLGVDALAWLDAPRIVGNATVGGAETTEIRATLNAVKLLQGIAKLTAGASKLGVSGTSIVTKELSPASIAKTAATIGHPQVTILTGASDHTLRKLTVTDTFALGSRAAAEFGGLKSVAISLSYGYSDLNQPQTITAPSDLKPYSQFQAKVESLLELLVEVADSSTSGGSATTSTNSGGGSATTSTSSGGANQKYSQCVINADGNISKLQKCASLL